jgi:hypothetical protein
MTLIALLVSQLTLSVRSGFLTQVAALHLQRSSRTSTYQLQMAEPWLGSWSLSQTSRRWTLHADSSESTSNSPKRAK